MIFNDLPLDFPTNNLRTRLIIHTLKQHRARHLPIPNPDHPLPIPRPLRRIILLTRPPPPLHRQHPSLLNQQSLTPSTQPDNHAFRSGCLCLENSGAFPAFFGYDVALVVGADLLVWLLFARLGIFAYALFENVSVILRVHIAFINLILPCSAFGVDPMGPYCVRGFVGR